MPSGPSHLLREARCLSLLSLSVPVPVCVPSTEDKCLPHRSHAPSLRARAALPPEVPSLGAAHLCLLSTGDEASSKPLGTFQIQIVAGYKQQVDRVCPVAMSLWRRAGKGQGQQLGGVATGVSGEAGGPAGERET